MQAYKKKTAVFAAAVLAGCIGAFAQSMEMPSMPTLSMPEMPSITAPTMDGKFYRPSLPSQTKSGSTTTENSTTESKSTESVYTDGTTTDDILITLLSNANLLSASDISDLYDTGSFDTLSSLTGLTGLTSSSSSTNLSTNILLRQILEKLNELKTEQNKASAAQQEVYAAKLQDSETFKTRNPSILRFKINGYNVKDSIIETFFSEPEPDGSFLLTGDRKYFVNNKSCTETFYMLFKAVKSNGSTTTYSVTPSIAQGTENKGSYVYKLCQCKDITAEKTGNLVVIHYNGSDVTTDLLLDIDK
ncbi:MAG: hypothetical protein J5726_03460 [Treponema sp.]|nr:hypothetical protein [Treponema sp.]